MNQRAEYLGKRSFFSRLLSGHTEKQTNTQNTHRGPIPLPGPRKWSVIGQHSIAALAVFHLHFCEAACAEMSEQESTKMQKKEVTSVCSLYRFARASRTCNQTDGYQFIILLLRSWGCRWPSVTMGSGLLRVAGGSAWVVTDCTVLHRESKKGATLTMAITLSVLDRFAKFFHHCKEQ